LVGAHEQKISPRLPKFYCSPNRFFARFGDNTGLFAVRAACKIGDGGGDFQAVGPWRKKGLYYLSTKHGTLIKIRKIHPDAPLVVDENNKIKRIY